MGVEAFGDSECPEAGYYYPLSCFAEPWSRISTRVGGIAAPSYTKSGQEAPLPSPSLNSTAAADCSKSIASSGAEGPPWSPCTTLDYEAVINADETGRVIHRQLLNSRCLCSLISL